MTPQEQMSTAFNPQNPQKPRPGGPLPPVGGFGALGDTPAGTQTQAAGGFGALGAGPYPPVAPGGPLPGGPVVPGGGPAPGGPAPMAQQQAPPPAVQQQAPPPAAAQQQAQAPQALGDPNAALGQVQAAFQQKFGRAMSPEEQQALTKYVGYTGGPVSPDMLQKAMAAVGQYSGNLQNPGLGAPGGGGAPGAAPVTPQSLEAQQREQLMKLLKGEVPMTLDQNNPAIAAERRAFDRANSQATTRQRLAAGERAASRGTLGAGGFDADLAGIENAAAGRSTGFNAELLRNERQGQIDRLMNALGMTQQYGATQLQGQLGRGQLGLGYLNAMLGDKQAGNALGFNYTALQQQMNDRALQTLLSGL